MSGKPDDDQRDGRPAGTAADAADATLDLGIADILAALSVEAMMEEALETALAADEGIEPSAGPAVPGELPAADGHEDVIQAGPVGDEEPADVAVPERDPAAADPDSPAAIAAHDGDAAPEDVAPTAGIVNDEPSAPSAAGASAETADAGDSPVGDAADDIVDEERQRAAAAPVAEPDLPGESLEAGTPLPETVAAAEALAEPEAASAEAPAVPADIPDNPVAGDLCVAAAPSAPPAAPRPVPEGVTGLDLRLMAAAIRLSRSHLGRTATNPSVGTLIVRDGVIVGRGVTAIGGRPHAETQALAEAGDAARGATAYVTLEPCAHHGRTPPCAEALVAAGIARVVGAAADPDDRVSGRGYAILRAAGIEVVEGVLADEAADLMAGYLSRSSRKRPEVTLKLAISSDGMLGIRGGGQVTVTGGISRAQVHLMRARSDVILVGIGTVEADDPELDCRLPGLSERSPVRVVLDRAARLPMMSKLALSARSRPLYLAVGAEASPVRRSSLEMLGVRFLATEAHDGRIALPELLEDLAGLGFSTVMVEGGAATARAFLDDGVVDRIALFRGAAPIGENGIASPLTAETVPEGFALLREARFGVDQYWEWVRH
jgi:diaminohydroxyphosphoribosylaminopyrimidine deaminase/5-amino-6-(5-phosphoribosylamino)uracil reductase